MLFGSSSSPLHRLSLSIYRPFHPRRIFWLGRDRKVRYPFYTWPDIANSREFNPLLCVVSATTQDRSSSTTSAELDRATVYYPPMRFPIPFTTVIRQYTTTAMPKSGAHTTKLAMLYQVSSPSSSPLITLLIIPVLSGDSAPFVRRRSQASEGKWLPGLMRRHRCRHQQDHQCDSSERQHRSRAPESYQRQSPCRD